MGAAVAIADRLGGRALARFRVPRRRRHRGPADDFPALANIGQRAGVTAAYVVDQDGQVTGPPGALSATVARFPLAIEGGRRDGVVAVDGRVYRLILSPVMAPTQVGRVILAVRLDGAEMRSLERLSAIPLIATMMRRDPKGHWEAIDGSVPAGDGGGVEDAEQLACLRGEGCGNIQDYLFTRPVDSSRITDSLRTVFALAA